MPVVRATTKWITRSGKVRVIRLHKSWRNLIDRIRGIKVSGRGGFPIWAGLECEFADWHDFRAWALATGYSKTNCSLDRKDSRFGYIKSNLRWVTPLQNSTFANLCGGKHRARMERVAARKKTRSVCEVMAA